uniref:Uncharacterized protein n=2 Tax=Oryza brachyantha TaxID=4533 RepID=J3LDY7_ORYBR
MERDRLEAARELEDQRVQFFLKMQMELSKANTASSSATAAAVAAAATAVAADVNGTRRTPVATDVGASSNHHVRYRFKDSGRHRQPAQQPQYSENNVAGAARGTGNGSDTDNKDDEDEAEDEEDESQ